MKTIETQFDIGDIVYTASSKGIDKKIIKAIKITEISRTIEYGFPSSNNNLFFTMYRDDGYSWYTNVFATEEEAMELQKLLKVKKDKEQEEKVAKEIQLLKEQLVRDSENIKRLEEGKNPIEYETD